MDATITRIRRSVLLLAAVLALVAASCTSDTSASLSGVAIPQPTSQELDASGLAKLPIAPASQRVDLVAPPFSTPTEVTNPLFPIADLHSAVLNGVIDGKPFHTETTLLPYTRIIEWIPGQQVETLVSQYSAFLDGRIQEVALDYYAQADDGSVWYFGEDVNDYVTNGQIAFTTDSWLAGRDGPPAMIMPGDPKVGQAFRTENIPGTVFEEVTVKTTDDTVPGPLGPVTGAMVGSELHDDGARSDKTFAPGYGEFLTKDTDGVEAMALAVPTDAAAGGVPAELTSIETGALHVLHDVRSGSWDAAATRLAAFANSWTQYVATGEAPVRLKHPMHLALTELSSSIDTRNTVKAESASIAVARAALDVELRYRPPTEIDLSRFRLWAQQLLVDVAAGDTGGVSGDVASMEWTRDRFENTIPGAVLAKMNRLLLDLRGSQVDGDMAAVSAGSASLLRVTSQI